MWCVCVCARVECVYVKYVCCVDSVCVLCGRVDSVYGLCVRVESVCAERINYVWSVCERAREE